MSAISQKVDAKTPTIKYPKLMEHPKRKIVILFTELRHGTVIFSENTSVHPLGYHSTQWVVEEFIDYAGVVSLENE